MDPNTIKLNAIKEDLQRLSTNMKKNSERRNGKEAKRSALKTIFDYYSDGYNLCSNAFYPSDLPYQSGDEKVRVPASIERINRLFFNKITT